MLRTDISDAELLQELKERFENSQRALFDITAMNRKILEMNARLEQAEAAKGHFIANMRNEIVDPIASIMGLSNQMQQVSEPADLFALARSIQAECSTLDFHMRNIFTAAELEAGTANPSICEVVVASVVDASVELFASQAEEKGVTVRTSLQGADVFPTDAANLKLILDNLLSNAVDFSSSGGCVEIDIATGTDNLLLTVRDEGPGIPQADLQKVFDRFRQLDSRLARCHRGQGLGLTVVKALLDLLGGDISVMSWEGSGSTFAVRIPRAPVTEDDMFAEEGNVYVFDTAGEP